MKRPTSLANTVGRLFSFAGLKHVLAIIVCFIALQIQMMYRVPGAFLFLLLPWVSLAVLCLQLVLLVRHVFHHAPGELPLASAWRSVERASGILVRVFVYYSVFLLANGTLDTGPTKEHESVVTEIKGEEVDLGWFVPYTWATLRSWEAPGRLERILVRPEERPYLWAGQAVVVQIRPGFFKLPWVSRVEHDEGKYYAAVLETAPDARVARQALIRFSIQHRRWLEAAEACRAYLERYPDDYEFMQNIGKAFGGLGRFGEMLLVLEPFVTRRPSYEVHTLVGFAMWRAGRKEEAARLLESSIALDPESWWAHYFLGYVYRSLGKTAAAIAAFEKTLAMRPDFPEVRRELASLQTLHAAQEAATRRGKR